jgi:hypothetical protein
MSRKPHIPDWILYLLGAVVCSVVLSLLATAFLMGLPHAWNAALSWHNIRLRTAWIASVLIPSALLANLLIRFAERPRHRKPDVPGRRPPSKRGGLHR